VVKNETEIVFTEMRSCSHQYQSYTRVYPEVSGLVAWSKNCKWYSSLPVGAVVMLFCELL
jgi:hypothetical protein